MIWATRFLERANASWKYQQGSGKNNGTTTVSVAYSYSANFAIAICEGPIAFIRRIWADGVELDLTRLPIRIYTGDENQTPDPLIVAKESGAETPAYRGVAYDEAAKRTFHAEGRTAMRRLAEALVDSDHAIATAMTPRDFGPPTLPPRTGLQALAASDTPRRLAFVFGSERYGMANEDVYRCHAVASIPTDPNYGSLNLAQAVQVMAYEWRQALGGFDVVARTPAVSLASGQAVQGVVDHWEKALTHIGFLDPAAPRKLMPRLQQLFNRADLRDEEIHILRGIAKAMLDR